MQSNQENALVEVESYPETPEASMLHQKLYIMGLIPEIISDKEVDEFHDEDSASIEFSVRRGCTVDKVESILWKRLNMLLMYKSQNSTEGSLHLGFTTNPNNGEMMTAKFTASGDGFIKSAVFNFYVSVDILKRDIDTDIKLHSDGQTFKPIELMDSADYGFLFYSGDSEECYASDEG